MNSPANGAAVGVLYDSLSPNTGDRAIGLAVSQELARHGVAPAEMLAPFGEVRTAEQLTIVGGGELIRPVGDPFYDRFRPAGPAVLNSAGVWPDADELEYLREYRLVSARSSLEVDVLRSAAPDAELVPCTTTTLESERYDIPGLPDDGEPVVGIHVVPHTLSLCPELVEAVNAIPHRKVFIPFTHYNHDDDFMRALPFDRSRAVDLPRLTPLQLHSVLGQMTYVVVSSLHATLFAYSQNVPFATVAQNKVVNYLRDRGLEDLVYRDTDSLTGVVRRLEEDAPDFSTLVERDKAAVHAWFAKVTEQVPERATAPVEPVLVPGAATDGWQELELTAAQRAEVIGGRDALLADVTRRASAARAELATERGRADRLEAEVRRLESERDAAVSRFERTMEGRARSAVRALRRRVSAKAVQ